MSKSVKWVLAVLLALGVVIVARASLLSVQYMPIVYKDYPIVPTNTPTPTLTPTPTKTPTKTPTVTKTPDTDCLSLKTSGVCITEIDYNPDKGGPLNEFIRLKNLSNNDVDMKNWRIVSDSHGAWEITKAFILDSKHEVQIWTKSGDDDSDDLYMDREEEFWNDKSDCAYVKDDDRETVDAVCYKDGLLGPTFFLPPMP